MPITVEETAGVARAGEPVTFGVPAPKGVVRDVTRLRLYSPDGRVVPAAFRVVSRWWDDAATQTQSIRWLHADFFADVPARTRAVYRRRLSDEPQPGVATPIRVTTEQDAIKVNTGPIQFTVRKTGPVLDAPGLRNADFLLRSDERIYKASQSPASELVVEEENPLRAVVRRTGYHAWTDGKDRARDYTHSALSPMRENPRFG